MTSRALVRVDADTLERLAFNSGHTIEPDPKLGVAFLTLGPTTFAAPLDVGVMCGRRILGGDAPRPIPTKDAA